MKINVSAVTTGTEVIEDYIAPTLASNKISAEVKDIKVRLLNKDGNWVDFPAEKIQFYYNK